MQKAIIAMLMVMLVIIVVFTSFGFAYSKNDFVSTMVKVEQTAGDYSSKTLETYKSFKSALSEISEFLNLSSLPARLDGIRQFFNETFGGIRNRFDFFNQYGIEPFSSTWWKKYNYLYKLRNSTIIKNVDGSYNWDAFEKLYLGLESGVLPDEFRYLEHNYNSYKQKCYSDLLNSDNYSLLFVSYTSANAKDMQSNYKKLCESEVPFICLKIPALSSLVFDSNDFLGLFSARQFVTDMLTEFEYPVYASFSVNIPDLSLTGATVDFVRFAEISDVGSMVNDDVSCRFRFNIDWLLSKSHTILGDEVSEPVDGSNLETSLLGISFGFYDNSRSVRYFEAGKIYLDYIEQNGLTGFAVPDFGYAVPTANIFSTMFFAYDEKGIISSSLK